eukprot:3941236-Rhodomonas_salina.2
MAMGAWMLQKVTCDSLAERETVSPYSYSLTRHTLCEYYTARNTRGSSIRYISTTQRIALAVAAYAMPPEQHALAQYLSPYASSVPEQHTLAQYRTWHRERPGSQARIRYASTGHRTARA